MKRPLRVGLTGGIGSGKSTVKKYFAELGVPTIDADEVSHQIAKPGQAAFKDIVELFGVEILDSSGNLRRQHIRTLVFNDPSLKKKLEAIIHPLVRKEIRAFINKVNYLYCIICIPLLLETNARADVDRILVIDAPEKLQVLRASRRDKTDEKHIKSIINAQIDPGERLRAADDIIVNDSDFENLKFQVGRLHDKYIELAP